MMGGVGDPGNRRGRGTGRRSVVDLKVAHVVGEAEHGAAAAGDLPAGGERRHLARKVLGKPRQDRFHQPATFVLTQVKA